MPVATLSSRIWRFASKVAPRSCRNSLPSRTGLVDGGCDRRRGVLGLLRESLKIQYERTQKASRRDAPVRPNMHLQAFGKFIPRFLHLF